MFNLLITLLWISLIDSHSFEEEGKWSAGFYILQIKYSAFPSLPPFIGDVLREYLTPLGPGVKEACVNASERYLALLNVSCCLIIVCLFETFSLRPGSRHTLLAWWPLGLQDARRQRQVAPAGADGGSRPVSGKLSILSRDQDRGWEDRSGKTLYDAWRALWSHFRSKNDPRGFEKTNRRW